MIDLRSDTVTRPGAGMLEAMMKTKVGDDVLGDDPAVKALEKMTAAMFGTEAALFFPSGTMANQVAIKVHTSPGDEVICDESSHIYNFEGGGIALNSGCSVKLLRGDRGRFRAEDVADNINDRNDVHQALTRLVAVENTSNKGGGSCYDFNELEKIAEVCRSEKLIFHLDGARLFNAVIRSGENPEQYGRLFDSISVCLSKGLGAPVGSVLVGDSDFIARSRRFRKAFGGGMRQAGYLAAAGIYALENNIERLAEDHRRAAELEETLLLLPYVENVMPVDTNIIIFSLDRKTDTGKFLDELKKEGIAMIPFGKHHIRAVTHLDFSDKDLESLISILKKTEPEG
ncbi:MAG: GntG family PLP-dependent aldolase [Bacteroidales bacterium]|nr:GntG family PLP-dependent aldolase [Bacteroidales bacterium]